MLTGAWWNVKTPTIRNCWRKAGLIKAPAQVEDNLEEDHSNPGDLWTEVEELLPDVSSFDDYAESDSTALTSADMTTEEIVNSVRDVSSDDDDDPKEEDSVSPNTEEDETISHSDVLVSFLSIKMSFCLRSRTAYAALFLLSTTSATFMFQFSLF
ncbi:hypothetical protein HPB51_020505 [Rhipicephalus microplus]|uniref:Tick transposon n=1 Tax=Rhipicephalus microplus TaxID=6941 RepID=A0A9J6E378_RHIMP|nr:hypothetical protein HPB51_020505 [Rhipicephalus microplus]